MVKEDPLSMSQKELLIRIDERQNNINHKLEAIEKNMVSKDDYQALKEDVVELKIDKIMRVEYNGYKEKVDVLWDWRNKAIGYAAALGAIFGVISGFIADAVKTAIFK